MPLKIAKGPGFSPAWLGKAMSYLALSLSLCSGNPPFLQRELCEAIHRTQLAFSPEYARVT